MKTLIHLNLHSCQWQQQVYVSLVSRWFALVFWWASWWAYAKQWAFKIKFLSILQKSYHSLTLPAYLFRGWKSASGSLYWRFFLVRVDLPLRVSRRLFFLQDLITITVALVTFGQHNLTSVTQLMRSVFISGQLAHASLPPLKKEQNRLFFKDNIGIETEFYIGFLALELKVLGIG